MAQRKTHTHAADEPIHTPVPEDKTDPSAEPASPAGAEPAAPTPVARAKKRVSGQEVADKLRQERREARLKEKGY